MSEAWLRFVHDPASDTYQFEAFQVEFRNDRDALLPVCQFSRVAGQSVGLREEVNLMQGRPAYMDYRIGGEHVAYWADLESMGDDNPIQVTQMYADFLVDVALEKGLLKRQLGPDACYQLARNLEKRGQRAGRHQWEDRVNGGRSAAGAAGVNECEGETGEIELVGGFYYETMRQFAYRLRAQLAPLVFDKGTGPVHICVYLALLQCSKGRKGWFENNRAEVMRLAKIRGVDDVLPGDGEVGGDGDGGVSGVEELAE